MKKWFGLAMGIALVALLAGAAFAQMGWGQQMGPLGSRLLPRLPCAA